MSDQKQTKENETMNAAQVLVRCLENEGVEYVFGIPGEENLEVMRALKDSKIKFITVRHEQGAAFMADVYGKLKGKAGVCLATLGPGATNLVTGVADANTDGAPLIAITGQVGTERMHLTSHQYLDLVTMFTPITKRSKQVVNPDTVNEVVPCERLRGQTKLSGRVERRSGNGAPRRLCRFAEDDLPAGTRCV